MKEITYPMKFFPIPPTWKVWSAIERNNKHTWMVWDGPKLLDDSGEVPELNKVIGVSILGCEIVSLFDGETSQVVKHLPCSKKNKKQKMNTRKHTLQVTNPIEFFAQLPLLIKINYKV